MPKKFNINKFFKFVFVGIWIFCLAAPIVLKAQEGSANTIFLPEIRNGREATAVPRTPTPTATATNVLQPTATVPATPTPRPTDIVDPTPFPTFTPGGPPVVDWVDDGLLNARDEFVGEMKRCAEDYPNCQKEVRITERWEEVLNRTSTCAGPVIIDDANTTDFVHWEFTITCNFLSPSDSREASARFVVDQQWSLDTMSIFRRFAILNPNGDPISWVNGIEDLDKSHAYAMGYGGWQGSVYMEEESMEDLNAKGVYPIPGQYFFTLRTPGVNAAPNWIVDLHPNGTPVSR